MSLSDTALKQLLQTIESLEGKHFSLPAKEQLAIIKEALAARELRASLSRLELKGDDEIKSKEQLLELGNAVAFYDGLVGHPQKLFGMTYEEYEKETQS